MGYAMEQLPKKVQKLVKKLADLQRKQVELMRCGTQGEKTFEELQPKIDEQFENGTKLVDELFSTQFAAIEVGIGFSEEDSFADGLHMMGLYLTERYVLDRMMCQVAGEKTDDDLLEAGTYLLHQSLLVAQEEDPYSDDDYDDFFDADDPLNDETFEQFGERFHELKDKIQPDAKIVPLFGNQKKGKKK